ncbi:MAG: hypothetical protein ACR2OR_07075 [Hyphomicrobiales bacterium]
MADQTFITSPSNNNTSEQAAMFAVRELEAHLRHMEKHLASLSNLARVAVKAQTRTVAALERDLDALLTIISQGRKKALRHLSDDAD